MQASACHLLGLSSADRIEPLASPQTTIDFALDFDQKDRSIAKDSARPIATRTNLSAGAHSHAKLTSPMHLRRAIAAESLLFASMPMLRVCCATLMRRWLPLAATGCTRVANLRAAINSVIRRQARKLASSQDFCAKQTKLYDWVTSEFELLSFVCLFACGLLMTQNGC